MKKNMLKTKKITWFLYFFIFLFYACSGGGDGTMPANSGQGPGFLDVSLVLDSENTTRLSNEDENTNFNCDLNQIATIEIIVYNKNGVEIANGGPWDCNLGQGTIFDIKPATGLIVVAFAKDKRGLVIFMGQEENVNVKSGETTYVGPIKLIQILNRKPVLEPIEDQSGQEGDTISFTISATDPDPDDILFFSASDLPPGAVFDDQIRQFSWTTGFEDAGTYKVMFRVVDNGRPPMSDSQFVSITIGNVNRPPRLDHIDDVAAKENDAISFEISGSDPDSNDILSFSAADLPRGASFDQDLRTFSWIPAKGQAGSYKVLFKVTDNGTPPLSDSRYVNININESNNPPVLDPIGSRSGNENELLEFTITGWDPDGDNVAFRAENLPPGAEFNPDTQRFSWTPGFDDAGNYKVLFTVADDGTPNMENSEEVTITIGNVNRPPEIDPIGNLSGFENEYLGVKITAKDPDNDGLSYGASDLPQGASFDPDTQIFSWTPGQGDAGTYNVSFNVTDNGTPPLADSQTISITVRRPNNPPVLAIIQYLGNDSAIPTIIQSVDEYAGQVITFMATAADPDGDSLFYSASNLPAGAVFDPVQRSFYWATTTADVGNYNVTFTVTDNGTPPLSDSQTVNINLHY